MSLINNCNDKSHIGSYIRETGQLIKFWINEHKKAVLKEDINNSAVLKEDISNSAVLKEDISNFAVLKEDISNSAMAAHFKLLHAF